MQSNKKIISKAFGSVTLKPRSVGVCTVVPPDFPYFEPKRCRIACLDARDPNRSMDLKIGAVTIGGSPQLAMNELTPSEGSPGLRPEDIDYVNWSVFSTVGLAREIQMSLYNPNDSEAVVFVCLEGFDVGDMDREFPDEDWEARASRKHDRFLEAERAKNEVNTQGWAQLAGSEVELDPLEQRIIRIVPTVWPYFDPKRVRFHGHRSDTGARVPFTIVDVFCGSQVLYGTMVEELFVQRSQARQYRAQETPQELLRRLQQMVDTLTRYGRSGLEMLEDRSSTSALEDARGMLSTHLVGRDGGWGDVSWWPILSTNGLKRALGVVAYNPWPFRIRASASLEGDAVASLECEDQTAEDSLRPEASRG